MKCKECKWWKADWGTFTATGWTGNGDKGYCHYEVKQVPKRFDDCCHNWEAISNDKE